MLVALAAAAMAGCASAPRSVAQSLEVEAVTPLGAAVPDARCVLRQGGAEWSVVPPARTSVMTSGEDLWVRCEAASAHGEERLAARVRGGRGVRALVGAGIGGVLGAAIGARDDKNNSNAMCCGDLGRYLGALLGGALGALAGAGSADPAYEYAAKVRVVLGRDAPAAAATNPATPAATRP